MHFEDKSFKDEKLYVFLDASCKVTAKTDKISRNESKICMASQIYGFFQCIFLILQFFVNFSGMLLCKLKIHLFQTESLNIKMYQTH